MWQIVQKVNGCTVHAVVNSDQQALLPPLSGVKSASRDSLDTVASTTLLCTTRRPPRVRLQQRPHCSLMSSTVPRPFPPFPERPWAWAPVGPKPMVSLVGLSMQPTTKPINSTRYNSCIHSQIQLSLLYSLLVTLSC